MAGRAPKLRVIDGLGQRRAPEPLVSRDAVARVLVGAGVDLLLRRISPERAEAIEREVEEILGLFDAVDARPALLGELERRVGELEVLVRDGALRRAAVGGVVASPPPTLGHVHGRGGAGRSGSRVGGPALLRDLSGDSG